MIKRILAAVAVSAAVAGGATAASAAQGTSTTRMSASETIMLTPQGGSMAHGKAVLTYSMMSHKTTVVLTLTGLAKNKPHLAHFHLGRCGSNGAIKYPLTTLQSMGRHHDVHEHDGGQRQRDAQEVVHQRSWHQQQRDESRRLRQRHVVVAGVTGASDERGCASEKRAGVPQLLWDTSPLSCRTTFLRRPAPAGARPPGAPPRVSRGPLPPAPAPPPAPPPPPPRGRTAGSIRCPLSPRSPLRGLPVILLIFPCRRRPSASRRASRAAHPTCRAARVRTRRR